MHIKRGIFLSAILVYIFVCLETAVCASQTEIVPEFIINEDMEKLTPGPAVSDCFGAFTSNDLGSSGSITVITEPDGNKCLKYEKNITGGGQIPHYTDLSVSGNGFTVGYDFVVELDFKYSDHLYDCTLIQGRKYDTRLRMQDFIKIVDSEITDVYDNAVLRPVIDRWYTISVALHELEQNYDIYIDGELVRASVPYSNNSAGPELKYTCIRAFNITNMQEKCTIYGDNYRIYNAVAPLVTPEPEPEEPKPEEPDTEADPSLPEEEGSGVPPTYDTPSAIIPSNNITKPFNETLSDKIFILSISGCAVLALGGCLIINGKNKT